MKNKFSSSELKYLHISLGWGVIASICNPAWSADDKIPSLDKNSENEIGITKKKEPDGNKNNLEVRDESVGSNKVKKKIVTGAGAAAVSGVVTKKVTSSIKDN